MKSDPKKLQNMFIQNERFRLHLSELQNQTQITEAIHQATKYNMGRRLKVCETVTVGDADLELSMELLLRLFSAYHMPNSARISTARVTTLCWKQKSKLAIQSNETKGEKGLYDWFNNDYIHCQWKHK